MARVAISDQVQDDIESERFRQIVKFGTQNHDPVTWLAILGEEVGEANQAALDVKFPPDDLDRLTRLSLLRAELIQVAAVAVAFVESLDRNELAHFGKTRAELQDEIPF